MKRIRDLDSCNGKMIKHLKNIFEAGELNEQVVISKMVIATPHGAIPGKTQNSPTNY